jgi:hypothetical protein
MASKEAFAAACIELFSRLWAELNVLTAAADPARAPSAELPANPRDEILRLELILVLDACRSERWRMMLDISQRLSLECLLRDVLDALSSSSGELPCTPIEWAQNRLLDALLEHCAGGSCPIVDRPVRRAAS